MNSWDNLPPAIARNKISLHLVKAFFSISLFLTLVLYLMPAPALACDNPAGTEMSCCRKASERQETSVARADPFFHADILTENATGYNGACNHSCACISVNITPAFPIACSFVNPPAGGKTVTKSPASSVNTSDGFYSIWRPPKLA